MFEKQTKEPGRRPDFVAREGVSIWTNQDKHGDPYLSVHVPLLHIRVNCFKNKEATTDVQDVQEEKVD